MIPSLTPYPLYLTLGDGVMDAPGTHYLILETEAAPDGWA